MFVVFLILCYFIIIFNVIVPKISSKLEVERKAYLEFANIKGDGMLCINNYLFTYSFAPIGGVTALIAINKKDNKPFMCSDRSNVTVSDFVSCGSDDIKNIYGKECLEAYSKLFFTS
ncbi:imv membrane protein, entry/fusion complex component [Pteropox virus]|uniref:Imv membrane protein, entry/fusion complex component n=1 Tax=Pteropox virus TaxID=1873698 RepID=A0A1B1MRN1_9POXV|nr:imv membrane protein, entry/fusion complex component [Pteropox virus]ANS71199.1 imv membrane protein, entry/fusion complex component [Pteropox virus]